MRKYIIIIFSLLSSCHELNKPIDEKQTANANLISAKPDQSADTLHGIIFFSKDNGLIWENKSNGLPETTRLGLGAIAVSKDQLGLTTKDDGIFLFDAKNDKWDRIPTEKRIIESDPGAMIFYRKNIFIGTQFGGVFLTKDLGKNWMANNAGLDNLTIRRFTEIDSKLYAGTNAGIFSYNELLNKWEWEYGDATLQVNGITGLGDNIYIATNQGAFSTTKTNRKEWKLVFSDRSLHNISSDDKMIYAMTYNELFSSADMGGSWQSIQKGLPAHLYTFNIVKNGHAVFASQWDGVYRKDKAGEDWKSYSKGLPEKLAIVNMQLINGTIIVSGNERRLRDGMSVDK